MSWLDRFRKSRHESTSDDSQPDSTDKPLQLSADRPLTDPDDDKLGFAPFARNLAAGLHEMAPTDGFVIAIYARWGSGKTTLLNFMKHYLDHLPQGQRPHIIEFNPWWFSGRQHLVRSFFTQLQARFPSMGDRTDNVRNLIGGLGDLVSNAPFLEEVPLAKTALRAMDKIKVQRDVTAIKERLNTALAEQHQRIVIFIDDIDRLTKDELRQLFGVIKSVVDFPNVTYVLSFDKTVVANALEGDFGQSGEDYLEKIIQVSFELPIPDRLQLRRLLFEKLDDLLTGTPEELFSKDRWTTLYFDGIDHFIRTPRDVVRLTNTLMVTFAAETIRREVNSVDFIAVETLRVFCSPVYNLIRNNENYFAGLSGGLSYHESTEKVFHDGWLESVNTADRQYIKDLVAHLFPRLGSIWSNMAYSESALARWRKERRVCSPEVFPLYFRLTAPEGSISREEIVTSLTFDAETFANWLLDLSGEKRPDGMSKVRAYLAALSDYAEVGIDAEAIEPLLFGLFKVGDKLIAENQERQQMFDFGIETDIGRVIWRLLPRLEQPNRYERLRDAIEASDAIALISREIGGLKQEHERDENSTGRLREPTLTLKQVEELEQIALTKIVKAAESGELMSLGQSLPEVLYSWRRWATDGDDPKKWAEEITSDDAGLAAFVAAFSHTAFRSGGDSPLERRYLRVSPDHLEPFVDLSTVASRLRLIVNAEWLSDLEKQAIEAFLKAYDLKQAGKDPDRPWPDG